MYFRGMLAQRSTWLHALGLQNLRFTPGLQMRSRSLAYHCSTPPCCLSHQSLVLWASVWTTWWTSTWRSESAKSPGWGNWFAKLVCRLLQQLALYSVLFLLQSHICQWLWRNNVWANTFRIHILSKVLTLGVHVLNDGIGGWNLTLILNRSNSFFTAQWLKL